MKDRKRHMVNESAPDEAPEEQAEVPPAPESQGDGEATATVAGDGTGADDTPRQLAEMKDKYLRLAAEFDNFKRLAQRDLRDQIRFGNEQLIKELLPVVDNLERAIKAAKDSKSGDGLLEGVHLTLKQLNGALGKFGVQAIPTAGQEFDPSSHQAVASVPSQEVPDKHIVEEFQRGYRLHDRILRPAMVTVSSGAESTDEVDRTS